MGAAEKGSVNREHMGLAADVFPFRDRNPPDRRILIRLGPDGLFGISQKDKTGVQVQMGTHGFPVFIMCKDRENLPGERIPAKRC